MCTAAETTRRLDIVFQAIMAGHSRREIVRMAEREWGIKSRRVDDLIQMAKEQFAEAGRQNRDALIGEAYSRLTELYKQAFKAGQWRVAKDVQAEINRLYGLNAPDKVEHTGKGGGPMEIQYVNDWRSNQAAVSSYGPDSGEESGC